MQDSSTAYADRSSRRRSGLLSGCLFALAIITLFPTLASGSDRYTPIVSRVCSLDGTPSGLVRQIGKSSQGRPIYAVLLAGPKLAGPGATRVLIISGQHGDEVSPVYAMLDLAEELAHCRDLEHGALIGNTAVVMVPVVNPDGFAHHRRLTARGVDLNRDWRAASEAETQAVRTLADRFRPHVVIDLHEWKARGPMHTNCVELAGFGAEPQQKLARLIGAFSCHEMAQRGSSEGMRTVFYRRESDNRLAHRYFSGQGMSGVLVETASGQPFEARKRIYREFVMSALTILTEPTDPRVASQLSALDRALGEPQPAFADAPEPSRAAAAGVGDIACWIVVTAATACIMLRDLGTRRRKLNEAPLPGRQTRIPLTDMVRANLPLHERVALIQQQRVRPSDRGKQIGASRAA